MPRYEFKEGASNKFWQIDLEGTSFTTTYGKIGTDGQISMKEYDSEEKAQKEYDKLVAEKTKKGYVLVGGAGGADDDDDEDEAPKKKPAAKAAKAAPAKKEAAKPAAKAGGKTKGARYFEFVDGSSSKFWEIQMEGTSFTTRYGKIGTDGQISMKEYDTEEKAQKEYDKLVAEKTKKGYEEK